MFENLSRLYHALRNFTNGKGHTFFLLFCRRKCTLRGSVLWTLALKVIDIQLHASFR